MKYYDVTIRRLWPYEAGERVLTIEASDHNQARAEAYPHVGHDEYIDDVSVAEDDPKD